uniref:Replication protein A 70 kDa DNA-binding subunit n=1 Tax=Plectus sambesii TaxID=2011161 RepID=A0A914UIP5_9BILA
MNLELANTKSFGGGFSTASGKEVKISEEALNNARKLFKDEADIDDASTSNADSDTTKPMSMAAGGFATASGKPTTVSESALKKARLLFDDIDGSATTATTPTTPSFGSGARLSAAGRLQKPSSIRRSFQPPRAAPGIVRGEVLAEVSNGGNVTPIRVNARGVGSGVLAGSSPATQPITPIGAISPYTSKWKICGMVTSKEEIRTIRTARGDTKAFHFEMVDQEGMDVRVSAWDNLADKFHSVVAKGQMYYLSGATVKQTNKRFNTTKHEYELSLRSDSEIVSCSDRAQFAAPRIRFRFVKFDQLKNCIGSTVDVIGVVQTVDNVVAVPSRKTNEDLNKRDIHLVDDTNLMVTLTLWGEQARNFSINDQEHPIIALKGVSVREFRECVSLSMMGSTKMEMNPDFPEAYELS